MRVVFPEPAGADTQVTGAFTHWSGRWQSLGLGVASETLGGETLAMDGRTPPSPEGVTVTDRLWHPPAMMRPVLHRLSDGRIVTTFGIRFIKKGLTRSNSANYMLSPGADPEARGIRAGYRLGSAYFCRPPGGWQLVQRSATREEASLTVNPGRALAQIAA